MGDGDTEREDATRGPDWEDRIDQFESVTGQLSEVSPSYPKVKVGRWLEAGIHNLPNFNPEVSYRYKLKYWFQSQHQD